MDLGLNGKVVVVTGASKGIGLAVVGAFAGEGSRGVAGSRTTGDVLAGLAERHEVLPVEVDLSTPGGPAGLVARATEEFGRVDVLVNNLGGVGLREGFLSIEDEDWRQSLEFNVMSTVRASRAVLPGMVERGEGAIVNVSSVNAQVPLPAVADYSAAKAAMTNITKVLAEEFGPRGVRVNAVSPGPVLTPMWTGEGAGLDSFAHVLGTDRQGAMDAFVAQNGITLSRFAEAGEVASLVLFLASDRAGYVTGSDYVIDGGMIKTA